MKFNTSSNTSKPNIKLRRTNTGAVVTEDKYCTKCGARIQDAEPHRTRENGLEIQWGYRVGPCGHVLPDVSDDFLDD